MIHKSALLAAGINIAALIALPAQAADPAPVIAAERAFAADAVKLGRNAAFRAHVAPDAIALTPEPQSAKERLERNPNRPGPPHLVWRPVWASIASSEDLGFTTGPWVIGEADAYGYYFTIWRKQPDGAWKYVLDHGPSAPGPSPFAPDAPVMIAPTGVAAKAGVDAKSTLKTAENQLNAAFTEADRQKIGRWLESDVRAMGFTDHPAIGREAVAAALAGRPTGMKFQARDLDTSSAGDLGYSYGVTTWTVDGVAKTAAYMRMWRHTDKGWRLLFDQVLPRPS